MTFASPIGRSTVLLDVDPAGLTVLVVGARAVGAARRYAAAGADVRAVADPARCGDDALAAAALVVDATGGDPAWASILRRARGAVLVVQDVPDPRAGHITLVGAGPGDPGLQTVAGRRALAVADVVLTDRLATHDDRELVAVLAPGAQVVDVGKLPGHHRVAQREIEALLLEHARAGRRVVRLKGGDPFVFGRGGEEAAAARAAGIPVTVVPGVSSAVAVPASEGIPLTHRQVSRAFSVVSGHDPLTDEECAHLVGVGGTIVILMGVGTLVQTLAGLQRAGLDPATPVAAIEHGFTARQRCRRWPLAEASAAVASEGMEAPAVVVIGAVADLPELR